MGSGKSEAAISYMRQHPEKKFIYITPYRDEATRIQNSCSSLNFFAPKENSKIVATTYAQVCAGRNIASTHAAFKYYSLDMVQALREQKYTLIIDENLETTKPAYVAEGLLALAQSEGYLNETRPCIYRVDESFEAVSADKYAKYFQTNDLLSFRQKTKRGSVSFHYWQLSTELIAAFAEVFVLTYLFPGQGLYHQFVLDGLEFEYIGVRRTEDGGFEFAENRDYQPPYVRHLRDKIHICRHEKLNDIGKNHFDISKSWYAKDEKNVERLRKHVLNYFRNIVPIGGDKRLWATFSDYREVMSGDGYKKKYISCNERATNKYAKAQCLAYCVNIFMNVGYKTILERNGLDAHEDLYALSTMIQWIWRSAIRNGEDIYIYVPSRRMRELLENWIDAVTEGRDPMPVAQQT